MDSTGEVYSSAAVEGTRQVKCGSAAVEGTRQVKRGSAAVEGTRQVKCGSAAVEGTRQVKRMGRCQFYLAGGKVLFMKFYSEHFHSYNHLFALLILCLVAYNHLFALLILCLVAINRKLLTKNYKILVIK